MKLSPKRVVRNDTFALVLASATTAIAVFAVTIVAGWALSPADLNEFLVFWSVTFALFGLVAGTQNETTRGVVQQSHTPREAHSAVMVSTFLLATVCAVATALTTPFWASALSFSHPLAVGLLVSCGVVLYSVHIALSGALAGQCRWKLVSGLMAAESLSRLALVIFSAVIFRSLMAMFLVIILAEATWVLFYLTSSRVREASRAHTDGSILLATRRNLFAVLSAVGSTLLITGFPAVVKLVAQGTPAETLNSLILAITLTRAPIMIPLQALQGMAITRFSGHDGINLKSFGYVLLAITGGGFVLGILAAILGPWLVALLYPSQHLSITRPMFFAFTQVAAFMGWITFSGAASIAANRHRAYATGWLVASACSLLFLATPLPLTQRVIVALAVGPIVGTAIHLIDVKKSSSLASGVDASDESN